jgi:uncharacterized repeat protein (TIGR02543 family)
VTFLGDEPSIFGDEPSGDIGSPDGPLISYYERNAGAGFTSPTRTAGTTEYRSRALATVTFDANGRGTAPAPSDVVVTNAVANPGALTAPNYVFDGWFTAASGGTQVSFPDTVTGENFTPGETLEIWLMATPVQLTTVVVGTSGTFAVNVVIPADIAAGAHSIEVRCCSPALASYCCVAVKLRRRTRRKTWRGLE